jgi:hypothetical protein
MSSSYAGEVYKIAEELLDDLSQDDVQIVYVTLKELGLDGWCDWKLRNAEIVLRYVESSASQRTKLKLFKPLMPLLVLAAFQECLAGQHFLQCIESHALFPGQPYRTMARLAAEAFRDVYTIAADEYWPWPWLNSPFLPD